MPHPRAGRSALVTRLGTRPHGAPAIACPQGSRLSLENWKRAVRWRPIAQIDRPSLRVHDLRHTYASLARAAPGPISVCCRRRCGATVRSR